MTKAFIHSPLSPLFFFAMLALGIMGLLLTPRQEDPQISVPMVDIFVQYPGASSEQVASLAIEPLQRIMSEIPSVKHVYAASERGQGMVTVEFKVGQELEKSVFKVYDKLQSNLHKIPPGVSQPMVKPKGVDDVPIVNLTLWSDSVDDGALRTLAFDVLQALKEIPNTGQGFVVGGRAEQVRVEIIPERLSGFRISLDQVANTIRTANNELSAGTIESGNAHFTVYTGAFLRNAEDIARLVVGSYNDVPVYVRDIAEVSQRPEEVRQVVSYYSGPSYRYSEKDFNPDQKINGSPAVTIAIAKKISTNGVTVANTILAHVEELRGRMIPDNVHVEVTRNYGQSAKEKVDELIMKLFIATGLVTILVLYSLGWRPAVVVTLVIPVVILVTVFAAWILGFTIDRVSLFALIFSIGILVDDAIVVMENIYRRWLLKGQTDTDTAVDAVREVGNPTILATFTVVAALLPMGFVSGMMGPYMMPIPALGSVAMVFSLFAAFVFTPWLAMALKPGMDKLHQEERREHAFNEGLERFFRRLLTPLIEERAKGMAFLIFLVGAFFFAIMMFSWKWVEVKMMPLDNKPEFNVFINMPEGTALPVTANVTSQLVEKLREIPEVTALQSYVGISQPFDFNGMVRHYYLRESPWNADIHVQLTHKRDRKRSSHEIATEARRMLQEVIKGSPARITVVEMPPGPPVLQSIVAEIYGPDDTTRRAVAQKMTDTFEQAMILDDVDNYMSAPHSIWHFEVDTEKAVRRGISVDAINRNLSMALGNYVLGDIKQGTVLEPTYIVIQVPLNIRAQLSRLYDIPIPTMDQKGTVPLAELGKFSQLPNDPIIFHKDLRRIEYVVGDAVGMYHGDNKYTLSSPIYGMFEIEDLMANYRTPDGVEMTADGARRFIGAPEVNGRSAYEWTGEWTVTYETFRDMGIAFMAAMLLIYILVVWLFGNFIVPAVIMAPIPLTLLGIIPGHWLIGAITGKTAYFTATSMIGWIALAGIIVRNSILLVDYSIHEVQQGTPIKDAVILACKTRTRPIMITAFALVFGSFVILFDPIFQGMAISLLFGVLISTMLTLVVIPLGCISIGPEALCQNAAGGGPPPALESSAGKPSASASGFSLGGAMLWLWGKLIGFIIIVFYLTRMIVVMLMGLAKSLWQRFNPPKPPASSPPPSAPKSPPPAPPSAPTGGGQPPMPAASSPAGSTPPAASATPSASAAPAATTPPVAVAEPAPVAPAAPAAPTETARFVAEPAEADDSAEDNSEDSSKPGIRAIKPSSRRGIRLKPMDDPKK
jgi:multidrug efflux pump subunit AcrB